MSTWLLRQDAALQALPRWMTVSSAVGLTALGLIINLSVFTRTKYGASLPDLAVIAGLSFVMWMSAATFLFTPAFRERVGHLAMTLPFTVKRLWLTHCAAVTLVGLVATAAMTLITIGMSWVVVRVTQQPPQLAWPAIVKLGTSVFVTFVLAVGVLQARTLQVSEVRWNAGFVRLATAVLVFGWAAATWLATLHAALLLVPAVATALLVTRTLQRLPTALASLSLPQNRRAPDDDDTQVAPAAKHADATAQAGTTWAAHAEGRYRAVQMAGLFLVSVHRMAPKAFVTAIFAIPGMMFFGFLLSGGFDAIDDDGSAAFRWISIALTIYMLLAIFVKPLRKMVLVDALPVSRRVLFALMIVPSLVLMDIGYGLGLWVAARYGRDPDVDFRVVSSGCSGVTVPHSMLRISWNGELPRIETPWGTSHEPWHTPLYRGSRAVLWSPYCSRDTSTAPGFAALQASRAAADLYGTHLAREDIQRLLDAEPERVGLPLREEHPELQVQARLASFPLMALLVCGGWFVVTALCLRTYRGDCSDRVRRWTLWSLLAFLMLLHMAQFVPFVLDFTEPWIVDAFWESRMRGLALTVPGGSVMIWAVAALLTLGLYRIAERQFERAEFLDGPHC